jgi:hypothetical protein
MDGWMPFLVMAMSAALLLVVRSTLGDGRKEAEALQRHARKHGRRFVDARAGGPAVYFDVDGHEGEARFRSGKRRFRLDNHVRVRIALSGADAIRLRITPPMIRHGRSMKMLYPAPASSQGRLPEDLFDVHTTSDAVLNAVLADGTVAFLRQRHPGIWLEIKNGRVEVRLAGEAHDRLIAQAIDVAIAVHARARDMAPTVRRESCVRLRRSAGRHRRRNARIGAVIIVAAASAALAISISLDWFGQERRNMTSLVYERRGPLCGFVRTLPLVKDYVGGVPCQVWNLMPLTGLGAIALGWLMLDVARSVLTQPRKSMERAASR